MTKQQIYERKQQVIAEMRTLGKEVSNGKYTAEQNGKFQALDTELRSLDEQLNIVKRTEQLDAEDLVRTGKEVRGGGPEQPREFVAPKDDSFINEAGIEIPVYNRRTKASVREDFEKRNPPKDDTLDGITFGQWVRARMFGPRNEKEKRALSEGTPSAGGYTVPQIISADFIDRLRPISRLMQAGANVFSIDEKTNKYNIAKLVSGPTIEWLAENAESTPSDMTFGNVQFAFKTARAIVRVSNELIQDSLNLDRVINTEATKAFASELDRVGLIGNGTTEPKGIINYSNHETVTIGANGAAPTDYDEIIALIAELQANNANVDGSNAAIMNPRTLAAYNVLKSSADSQPLQRPPYIQNMPFYHTTAVPITDTQGSSNVASKLFLGDWSQLYLGTRLGTTIIPLNQRYAEFNQTAFLIVMRVDWQPYHEESFGYVKGLLGASLPT